jgi:hypothetical protein
MTEPSLFRPLEKAWRNLCWQVINELAEIPELSRQERLRGEARQLSQEHKHRILAVHDPNFKLPPPPRMNNSQQRPKYLHGRLLSIQRASCGPNPTCTVESLGFSRTMKDKCCRSHSRLQSPLAGQFIFPPLLCPAFPVSLAILARPLRHLICFMSLSRLSHHDRNIPSKVHLPPPSRGLILEIKLSRKLHPFQLLVPSSDADAVSLCVQLMTTSFLLKVGY